MPAVASRPRRIAPVLACVLAGLALVPRLAAEPPSQPLKSPGPAGRTLFTPLAPEQTGVATENRYADPRMWGDLYQEFLFGAIGTGVAIGDYDGDGRPDLFVVSKTEGCRLFRNLGDFKFEDVTERAGVADFGPAAQVWKQGATWVDVNNDGKLDLYVCRFNAPNLLYVNQGNGTFKEEAHARGLDLKDACGMANFADYDRDGWLDVYVATNLLDNTRSPKGQRGYLLRNRGDGTFENVTERAGITDDTQSHSAAWWDYDNDGWPDLYVANDFGVPDKLYHNNGDGTFTDRIHAVLPHTAFSAMGTDVGDVNNDGLIDLIVADMAATTHQKDQRGPADLRGRNDDPADNTTEIPKYRRNALLLNTGTAHPLEAAYLAGLAVTDWTWSIRFEDLDNDGRLDLFVCNGMNKEENIDVNARMMRAESSGERIRIMRESPLLLENNLAFRNLGDLEFRNVSAAWGLDQKTISFGSAFGDLDGDGDLDLVYSNYQDGVKILRNDSPSGHRVIFDLRGTASNRFGIGAVVRIETAAGQQIRPLWLARGYLSSSEPAVHFGLGDDTIIRRVTVTWPSGRVQVVENLAADRRYTLTEPPGPAVLPPAPPPAHFAEASATAGFAFTVPDERFDETAQQRLLPVRLNRRGPGLAVGDLNGDGHDDVVVAGTTLAAPQVLAGDGAGHLAMQVGALPPVTEAVDDGPPLLLDVDGDGRLDLLMTKGGNSLPAGAPEYEPRLSLNTGGGRFATTPDGVLPSFPASIGAAVATDVDRDGRLDVFVGARVLPGAYPETPRSALWLNRGGRFEDVTDTFAPGLREVGLVTSALWSDADGDGWPDLIVALEWGGVRYFHNQAGRGLEDWTDRAGFAAAGTGWWTSLAAADFNGDGRPDFVAGNTGLNTQYHASPAQPALLYFGDFRGDDSTQLIEAYHEGDQIYPWRSRRDLGASIPSVLRKFSRNDYYARATLGEIVGEDKLAAARKLAATELRSGVFLSQPDGTWRFSPLPRVAQIAPLQGLAVGDFDGDGHADIYAVQNSYAPVPAVGRFDGGLSQLLRGDGRGGFTAVPPQASGLVVPGNAKALVALDLDGDGWADFLVTRNNQSSLAWRNQGVAGHHPLAVRLRGPAGNPAAVGARIAVAYRDGHVETQEIHAGGGYASQSSATAFFGWRDDNPAVRIEVRWPDGRTTSQTTPASPVITLTAP